MAATASDQEVVASLTARLRLAERRVETAEEEQSRAEDEAGSLRRELDALRAAAREDRAVNETGRVGGAGAREDDDESSSIDAMRARLEAAEAEAALVTDLTERVLKLKETRSRLLEEVETQGAEVHRLDELCSRLQLENEELKRNNEQRGINGRLPHGMTPESGDTPSSIPPEYETNEQEVARLRFEVKRLELALAESEKHARDERAAYQSALHEVEARLLKIQSLQLM